MTKEIVLNENEVTNDDVVILDEKNANDDIVDEGNENNTLPKRAKLNADGTVTLTLFEPVNIKVRDHNGRERVDEYKEFVFHRLKGADMRAIAAVKDDMANIVTFARATKINQAVMNKLFDLIDGSDIFAGGEILSFFTKSGQ